MHRLTAIAFVLLLTSCGGQQTAAPTSKAKTDSVEGDKPAAEEKTAADAGAEKAPEKKSVCTGFNLDNLEDLLGKSDCEVADAKPESLENPEMKGKLEVTVTASPTKVAPGAKADLLVTFSNKTRAPMPLSFKIDPLPRFETETYDAKKKRADMPGGQPPEPPKGHAAPPPSEVKVARVTIAPNGSARVRVPWEAVKMKWAPDKVRGTAVEKGYPRVPNGPLPKGKYTVKVVTPLIGVFEGGDHEVSTPKVDVEVGS